MSALHPRMETLPEAQIQLWRDLAPSRNLGFVLYGGTAIALRLGHRVSVDFDFFCEKSLDKDALRREFAFLTDSLTLQETVNSLTVSVSAGLPEQVKVSFFGSIDFGRVGNPDITADGALAVASLDDLMATKVKVVLQRNEVKDYQDIAAMINAGVALDKGLASARVMYGPSFQPAESLKALVYFEGGDLEMLTPAERNTLTVEVSRVRKLPEVSILAKQLREF